MSTHMEREREKEGKIDNSWEGFLVGNMIYEILKYRFMTGDPYCIKTDRQTVRCLSEGLANLKRKKKVRNKLAF